MSIKYLQNDIERVDYIKKLLLANSRDANIKNMPALKLADEEYKKLRKELLDIKNITTILPSILRTTDSLFTFNADMKSKFVGTGSYSKRAEHIESEFSQVINYFKGIPTKMKTNTTYSKEQISIELNAYFKEYNFIENIYGKFTLEIKSLGSGGTSIVKGFIYEERSYAIKFLEDNFAKKESTAFKRFKQAHLNLLTLQSTGVILPQIHFDALSINDNLLIPYVIMPIAEKTLKKYIDDKKNPTIKDTNFSFIDFNKIYNDLLNIIQTIHDNNIIHRDIKPENLFIINKKLVLGDFDIAKFDKNYHIKLAETKKSDRLANYYYSSPEQSSKKAEDVTEAADWFAFGQVLHWLITGDVKKGQGAIRFEEFGEEYKPYESLVEKLLDQDSDKRLNTKERIEKHILDNSVTTKEESIHKFDNFINKYSVAKQYGKKVIGYDSVNKIKDILHMLAEEGETYQLQWCEGGRDSTIDTFLISTESDNIIRFDGREIKIKSIWFYKSPFGYGGSLFAIESDDFNTAISQGNSEYDEEFFYEYHGKRFSEKEFKDGWGIIDEKEVKLDGTQIEIVRQLKKTIIFIGSKHKFFIGDNFKKLKKLHSKYKSENELDEVFFEDLKDIRRPEWIRFND